MSTPPKSRTTAARLSGLAKVVKYPVGTVDILYRVVTEGGQTLPDEHALRLVVSSDECRQLARHIELLAAEIEAMGGAKQ